MVEANSTLKALRLACGLTQKKLSDLSGVSTRTISRAEAGLSVSDATLSEIARALEGLLGHDVQVRDLTDQKIVPKKISRRISSAASKRLTEQLQEDTLELEQIANAARVSKRTLRNWLTGKNIPSSRTSRRMIDVLLERDLLKPEEAFSEDESPFLGAETVQNPVAQTSSRPGLRSVAESIPDQNTLIRFGLSPSNKLTLVPALNEENDYETIEALRGELLANDGPLSKLLERYATNPNLPQASLFRPLTISYEKELSKNPREINYAVLYARGARYYAARRSAELEVNAGEWPELDAEESSAIDAICDLHGPLIMASAVGRRLVSDAHEYETTPEVFRKEQALLEEFGQTIAQEEAIFEPEAAEAVSDFTVSIKDDPQPARTRGIRLMVTGSALVAIVGGVAWLSAGGGAAAVAVPLIAGYGASKFLWEVAKKTDAFKQSTDELAARYDRATEQASAKVGQQQLVLLKTMQKLVDRKRGLFAQVASIRPEFSWAKKYINVEASPEQALPDDLTLHQHIGIFGPRGSGKTTIGTALAERLRVPFRNLEHEYSYRIEGNIHELRGRVGENPFIEGLVENITRLLKEPPSVIDLGSDISGYEEVWRKVLDGVLPVVLKYGSETPMQETDPNKYLFDRYSLTFNVTYLNPEEIVEAIVRKLFSDTEVFFPGGP